MLRSIARDKNNSFPENLCQIIAFKLLEDVTKHQFVQSPVTLVINIQSQNEYKCTQDVFRVLKIVCITFGGGGVFNMYFFGLEVYNF